MRSPDFGTSFFVTVSDLAACCQQNQTKALPLKHDFIDLPYASIDQNWRGTLPSMFLQEGSRSCLRERRGIGQMVRLEYSHGNLFTINRLCEPNSSNCGSIGVLVRNLCVGNLIAKACSSTLPQLQGPHFISGKQMDKMNSEKVHKSFGKSLGNHLFGMLQATFRSPHALHSTLLSDCIISSIANLTRCAKISKSPGARERNFGGSRRKALAVDKRRNHMVRIPVRNLRY